MIGDFGAYYHVFYMISAFLVQKNRISQAEQSRLLLKVLVLISGTRYLLDYLLRNQTMIPTISSH